MRGESDRVAARVRALLDDYGREGSAGAVPHVRSLRPDDGPVPVDGPAPVGGSSEPAGQRERPLPAIRPYGHSLLARLPIRVDPGRGGAFAVAAAVVVAALVTGLWLITQRPRAMPVVASGGRQLATAATPVSTPAAAVGEVVPAAAPPSQPSSSAAQLVVDVAGKVRRPGLYRLPAGARVDDAITAAGGPRRGVDLSSLNLAALLVDGQQILVGRPPAGVVGGAPAAGGAGTSAPAAPVSLNSATLDQLESLPGVGPVLAQKIIDWRTANGGFDSVSQLTDVSGIGDVTFAELQPLVSL